MAGQILCPKHMAHFFEAYSARCRHRGLLDYLQNARPPSSNSQVFLTTHALYHPLPRSSSLSVIIERRIQTAGIEIPSKGAHAFRHGFATWMLEQGQPLKAIADVLGHVDIHSTQVYLRATPELTEEVVRRFHNYYLQQIKAKEDRHDTLAGQLYETLLQSLPADPERSCD